MTLPWWHPVLGDEEAQAVADVSSRRASQRRRADGAVRGAHRFASPASLMGSACRAAARRSTAPSSRAASGPGDEVVVPDLTFVATANAVRLAGARPVLADIRRADFTLDPASVEEVLTPKTRAIVPVHVNGRGGSIEEIVALADRHGLVVVEDAAEALGSRLSRPAARLVRSRGRVLVRADEDRDDRTGRRRRHRRPGRRKARPGAQGSGPCHARDGRRGRSPGLRFQLQADQRPGGYRPRAARAAGGAASAYTRARGLVRGGARRVSSPRFRLVGGDRAERRGPQLGRRARRRSRRPWRRTLREAGADPREFWFPLHTQPQSMPRTRARSRTRPGFRSTGSGFPRRCR